MYLANSDHKHPLDEHLIAVARLAIQAAKHLGLPEDVVELCGVAGMLHDIGKVLPDFQNLINNEDLESAGKKVFCYCR
jgi:putative nucleotidyltransferase with HDIG domain